MVFYENVRIKGETSDILRKFSQKYKISMCQLMDIFIFSYIGDEKTSKNFEIDKKSEVYKLFILNNLHRQRVASSQMLSMLYQCQKFIWRQLSEKDCNFDLLKENVKLHYVASCDLGMKKEKKKFKRIIQIMNSRKKGDSMFFNRMRNLIFSDVYPENSKSLNNRSSSKSSCQISRR